MTLPCGFRQPERETKATRDVPPFRDFVQDPWKEANFERYRPWTQRGMRYALSGRILPEFGSKPLDHITPAHVRRWFDAFSRTAPGNANHCLRILRQIMNFAVACGHIDKNPARGIRLNRRPALTRFLSREEISRLYRVLDAHGQTVSNRQQADIIRLLLLTGCRRSEIVQLRWSEVDNDRLILGDSKVGPRKVPLNAQARRILERQPRGGSAFVFPSPLATSRPRSLDLQLWYRVRLEAGIEDVRLHDLAGGAAT